MSKLSYTYTMSADQIDKAVPALKKRDASLNTDWHKTCVSVLHNWATSGAANVAAKKATTIVQASGYRNQSIVKWFAHHAGFEWDGKKFAYTRTKLANGDEDAPTVFQNAKAEPFWKLDPPKSVKPVKLLDELERVLTRAKKRMGESEEKRSDEDAIKPEHVHKLEVLLDELST